MITVAYEQTQDTYLARPFGDAPKEWTCLQHCRNLRSAASCGSTRCGINATRRSRLGVSTSGLATLPLPMYQLQPEKTRNGRQRTGKSLRNAALGPCHHHKEMTMSQEKSQEKTQESQEKTQEINLGPVVKSVSNLS